MGTIVRLCALNSRGLLVPTYGLGVVGAFLQVAGANWDVSSHVLGIVDTFFTPPHLVLYLGILLSLVAGIIGVLIIRPKGDDRQIGLGLKVSLGGSTIQLIAAPLDFTWHELFGFDPFLFTPTHSMLIVGLALCGIGMTVGAMRLLRRDGSSRTLKLLGTLSLATIWLDLNFLVLWLINAQGVAYTFAICSPEAIYA